LIGSMIALLLLRFNSNNKPSILLCQVLYCLPKWYEVCKSGVPRAQRLYSSADVREEKMGMRRPLRADDPSEKGYRGR
jgi:hypothetical protein